MVTSQQVVATRAGGAVGVSVSHLDYLHPGCPCFCGEFWFWWAALEPAGWDLMSPSSLSFPIPFPPLKKIQIKI